MPKIIILHFCLNILKEEIWIYTNILLSVLLNEFNKHKKNTKTLIHKKKKKEKRKKKKGEKEKTANLKEDLQLFCEKGLILPSKQVSSKVGYYDLKKNRDSSSSL